MNVFSLESAEVTPRRGTNGFHNFALLSGERPVLVLNFRPSVFDSGDLTASQVAHIKTTQSRLVVRGRQNMTVRLRAVVVSELSFRNISASHFNV